MSIHPRDVPYALRFTKQAAKEFSKLEPAEQEQIWDALLVLCAQALGDIRQMKGEFKGNYRLAAGDLRIVFKRDGQFLEVQKVGRRKDMYKN
jgi:mRNA-degrading endonuclease RelE of RelBE toxin-antitoxin system